MIESLLINAGTALVPALGDGLRGLFARLTGGAGARPQNMKEHLQLIDADVRRLQALADIDKAEGVSTWVANTRAMMRPVACTVVLVTYVGVIFTSGPPEHLESVGNYAQMVTFYLFGERGLMHRKRSR